MDDISKNARAGVEEGMTPTDIKAIIDARKYFFNVELRQLDNVPGLTEHELELELDTYKECFGILYSYVMRLEPDTTCF